ncbi:MAG: LITAF-like zinc ribbon domain-containing protein [Acidobacteriota bacterium]
MTVAIPQQQYDYSPPRPYSWKTDEFQTQNEPRKTAPVAMPAPRPAQFTAVNPNYQVAPIVYHQNSVEQSYLCPRCMNRFPPRYERKISTTGWIVFAVLLITFFPLFWIGLLIKEDTWVCQACNARLG